MKKPKFQQQGGFTLVELMVALALSLLVVAASVSALLVSRQGFTSVDAATQLRDNARFAADFITRLSVQSGFRDINFIDTSNQNLFKSVAVAVDPAPPISGFDNATIGSDTSDPIATTTNGSRSSCATAEGSACANGSDILVMRYQVGSRNSASELGGGSLEVDNAMFNCAGIREMTTPTTSNDVIESMLYVAYSATANNGEPTLMCKYRSGAGMPWAPAPTPLVQGIESFQVLYGTDGVVPLTAPVAAAPLGTKPNIAPITGQPDSIPERYLRADQMIVAGNTAATNENWRRVRSLRIGMVVRGAVGSAQDRTKAETLYPLGETFNDAASSYKASSGAAAGTGDGRLRQVVTFTVYLHNFQGM
jgi:type IV pilus assembly protein PilW